MKYNWKKTAGTGAMGLALLSSLSVGAFAGNADVTPNMETDFAKAVLVETEGSWFQMREDGGVTWQDTGPAIPAADRVTIPLNPNVPGEWEDVVSASFTITKSK